MIFKSEAFFKLHAKLFTLSGLSANDLMEFYSTEISKQFRLEEPGSCYFIRFNKQVQYFDFMAERWNMRGTEALRLRAHVGAAHASDFELREIIIEGKSYEPEEGGDKAVAVSNYIADRLQQDIDLQHRYNFLEQSSELAGRERRLRDTLEARRRIARELLTDLSPVAASDTVIQLDALPQSPRRVAGGDATVLAFPSRR